MSESLKDPGLGQKFDREAKRAIDKQGRFNVKRVNFPYTFKNTYQSLIRMNWLAFFTLLTLLIVGSNLFFATLYFLIGKNELSGLFSVSPIDHYFQCLYFSFQSFTTVGFGSISPVGHWSSIVSSIESVYGLICFAFVTGLLYGRFSRPNARFQYSKYAIVVMNDNTSNLQFRIVNGRSSLVIELQAKVMISYTQEEEGKFVRRFYNLDLERDSLPFLPLNWTIVHNIDKLSPLYDLSQEDLKKNNAEIIISIKGFDDTFSQIVHSRYSYTYDELVWGAKFVRPYYINEQGETVLDSDKIDLFEYDNLET